MEASFLHGSSAIHTQHKPKIIGCLQETVYCVLVQHFNPEKLSKKNIDRQPLIDTGSCERLKMLATNAKRQFTAKHSIRSWRKKVSVYVSKKLDASFTKLGSSRPLAAASLHQRNETAQTASWCREASAFEIEGL